MRWTGWVILAVAVAALVGLGGAARADKADLQREIEVQKAAARDLGGLDRAGAAHEDRATLLGWLDDAAERLRAGKVDIVRDTLNRCIAQAELIRQVIKAAEARAEVADRRKALADSRKRIKELEAAIAAARAKKASLEAKR